MNKLGVILCALGVCGAAILAGCALPGHLSTPLGISASKATPQKATFAVLHSFGSDPADGEQPQAPLVEFKGALYGTTLLGGSGCYSSGGCGTVYVAGPSGGETVLYSFTGAGDGAFPYAGLKAIHGTLYGTTGGGASTGGTLYSITPSGNETVLYQFRGGKDGQDPHAGVVELAGALYGTTVFGGTKGRGTVYKVATPSDKESVLYNFLGRKAMEDDGKYPNDGLITVDGVLYGTTYKGGSKDRGSVFKVTPSGEETVVHSFQGGQRDGAHPRGSLIDVNGTLYGTTTAGGIGGCKGCGNFEHFGTIFEITASGKEHTLYRFTGYPNDGASPYGNLVYSNGTLYGTTASGGAGCADTHGCGTIFSITPAGEEKLLYSFVGRRDGAQPLAGLVDVNGTFYGTTSQGGTYNAGTLFAFTP